MGHRERWVGLLVFGLILFGLVLWIVGRQTVSSKRTMTLQLKVPRAASVSKPSFQMPPVPEKHWSAVTPPSHIEKKITAHKLHAAVTVPQTKKHQSSLKKHWGWRIQVGSFKTKKAAEALKTRLSSTDEPVLVQHRGGRYQVLFGVFKKRTEANAWLKRLKKEFGHAGFLRSTPLPSE